MVKQITGFWHSQIKVQDNQDNWCKLASIVLDLDGDRVEFTLTEKGLDTLIENLQAVKEETFTDERDREKIRGLLARAYTTTENEKKVLDEVLLNAMAERLIAGGISI